MPALKPLTKDRAYITIRSLLYPRRVTMQTEPTLAVFVGAETTAAYSGDTWEEIIKKITIEQHAN